MKKKDKQVNFRVRAELLEWLKEHAIKNHRSITAQLNMIIEKEKDSNAAT